MFVYVCLLHESNISQKTTFLFDVFPDASLAKLSFHIQSVKVDGLNGVGEPIRSIFTLE